MSAMCCCSDRPKRGSLALLNRPPAVITAECCCLNIAMLCRDSRDTAAWISHLDAAPLLQAQEDAAAPCSGPTSAAEGRWAFAHAIHTQALQPSEDQAAAAGELPAHLQQAPAQLRRPVPASGPGGYGAGAAAPGWQWPGSQQHVTGVRLQAEHGAGPFTQQPSQYSQVDEGCEGGPAGQGPSPAAAAAAAAGDHASGIQLPRQGYGVLPPAATRGSGGTTATQHSRASPNINAAAPAAPLGTGESCMCGGHVATRQQSA